MRVKLSNILYQCVQCYLKQINSFYHIYLFRQIEQLQKKKGTEEQKVKNGRKGDRFKKEIHIINKFEKMTVAKFSLINLEKSVEDDAINTDGIFTSFSQTPIPSPLPICCRDCLRD